MDCTSSRGDAVVGVHLRSAPLETTAQLNSYEQQLQLWMPLLPGREALVDVLWEGRQEQLQLTWEKDKPTLRFAPLAERPEPDAGTAMYGGSGPRIIGSAESCPKVNDILSRECVLGSRVTLPTCPEGQANAGSAGHCFALCGPDLPCAAGVCTDWSGGKVCL